MWQLIEDTIIYLLWIVMIIVSGWFATSLFIEYAMPYIKNIVG